MKEVYTAASDGNEDLLKDCIAKGANVNGYKDEVRMPSIPGYIIGSIIYIPWHHSCSAFLSFLIASCSYPTSHEQKGNIALIAATEKNNPAIVKLLLEAGADKDAKDNVSLNVMILTNRFYLCR
jgi:ankyrin repeat protein